VTPEILFVPRRSARAETWTGHMYSPQEAAQLSGVKEIWETSEFAPFVAALAKHEAYRPKPENVLMSARSDAPTASGGFDSLFNASANKEAGLYLLANFSGLARAASIDRATFRCGLAEGRGLYHSERFADLRADAFAQIADGIGNHAARDRHQH
jgi:hypothetical protein